MATHHPRSKGRIKPRRALHSKAAGSLKGKKTVGPAASSKRFRIAFSFAGQKRDYVRKVADILAKRFKKEAILYDKFHEAEFSRARLGRYLPKLYHEQSDLIVVVVCPDYQSKEWCGLEWDAIFDLLKKRREDEVMLTRFDHAMVEGLYSDAGFSELDEKSPRQTADLILERLALNARDSKGSEGSQNDHPTLTPNNLPRLQFFFGRESDLKKIADSLAEDARGWGALIDGPGGIGKTSLAVRAAELVPHGRFRRTIFLSSKERELTADGQRSLGGFVVPSYLEMLNAIARELNHPDLAKSSEAERSSAMVRILGDANVLLVLDNLETLPRADRDQLFAFLDRLPRGCSAIVTSRRRADASAVLVRLDRLDWSAAEELITELAKENERLREASPTDRRSLYEDTGGNPLLIRWIVGQLGLGRCRDIPTALEFLRSAPTGNNPLEFIFGDLLDTFTENETKVLAALSYFGAAIETKFISELANVNYAAAEGALSDLSSRALVLPDSEDRSFALVPMVADFLRRRRSEVIAETGKRLEERAYALVVENGYNRHECFPMLDRGWPAVQPALSLFLAGTNERLQTVCDALDIFLNFTGRWDEWLLLSLRAETKALAANDQANAGWRVYSAAWVHHLRNQADDVLICAERAATHWKVQGDSRERALAMRLRGIGHKSKEDYEQAIAAFDEALRIHRVLSPLSEDVSTSLNDLGETKRMSGQLAAAETDYNEALHIAQEINDTEGVANITGNLALLALQRENWALAERQARNALSLFERMGRQEAIASNCSTLTGALLAQGKAEEGLPYARRAVEILARIGSPRYDRARARLLECENCLPMRGQ